MKLIKTEAGYGPHIQGLPFLGTTYSATMSTASTAFSTDFTSDAVRVVATADCFYTRGTAPVTATTSKVFLPAGVVEYVGLEKGAKRIAFITTSSPAGTFYATEVL